MGVGESFELPFWPKESKEFWSEDFLPVRRRKITTPQTINAKIIPRTMIVKNFEGRFGRIVTVCGFGGDCGSLGLLVPRLGLTSDDSLAKSFAFSISSDDSTKVTGAVSFLIMGWGEAGGGLESVA